MTLGTSTPSRPGLHFAASAPEWVHLVPSGTFTGSDGRGPYTLGDPAAVIRASMAAGKLPIDENHAIDVAAPQGQPSPARGWIVEMQARPDGIWGKPDWTATGRAVVEGGGYRGVSPVMETDKSGNVLRVLRAALTNTPNLPQLATLHSAQLGLTEQDLTVCRAMNIDPAKFAAHRGVTAHAELAPYSGALSQDHLRALRVTGQDEAKLREELARKEERERLEKSLSAQDLAICKAMGIDPMKFAAMRGKTAHAAQPGTAGLTESELQVCRQYGVAPVNFAEQKRRNAQAAAAKGATAAVADDLGLTDEELAVCKRMGINPATLAERKKQTSETEAGTLGLSVAEYDFCKANGIDPAKYAALKSKGALAVKPSDTPPKPDDLSDLTAEEREHCKRMGIDLEKVAALRKQKNQRNQDQQLAEKLGVTSDDIYLKGRSPFDGRGAA